VNCGYEERFRKYLRKPEMKSCLQSAGVCQQVEKEPLVGFLLRAFKRLSNLDWIRDCIIFEGLPPISYLMSLGHCGCFYDTSLYKMYHISDEDGQFNLVYVSYDTESG
jgi:hypothetical protein